MRLSDPSRAMEDARSETEARMRDVPRSAVSGVERALDELRNALSETDMPSNPEARDVMDRARSLTDELDARISEATEERTSRERRWREDERRFESEWQQRDDRTRTRSRGSETGESGPAETGPVRIDVTEEGTDASSDDAAADDGPTVDVDAELESIKRDVKGDGDDGDDGHGGDDAEPSDR